MTDNMMVKLLEEVADPRELFEMVMLYADKVGRDAWTCLGEVLNPDRYTVVIYEVVADLAIPIGYANTYITEYNELFFHHGYMAKPSANNKQVLETICQLVQENYNQTLTKVIIHSKARLWLRYGFTESKEKIYTREFPVEGGK